MNLAKGKVVPIQMERKKRGTKKTKEEKAIAMTQKKKISLSLKYVENTTLGTKGAFRNAIRGKRAQALKVEDVKKKKR